MEKLILVGLEIIILIAADQKQVSFYQYKFNPKINNLKIIF